MECQAWCEAGLAGGRINPGHDGRRTTRLASLTREDATATTALAAPSRSFHGSSMLTVRAAASRTAAAGEAIRTMAGHCWGCTGHPTMTGGTHRSH